MTKLNLFIIAMLSGSILTSCFSYYDSQQSSLPSIIYASQEEDNRYETTRTKRDKNRSRSRSGDSCYDHKDCENICEDIYDDNSNKDNEGWIELCLDLRANTVEEFERVVDYLSEPSPGNMKIIEEKYLGEFETMVEISITPFVIIVKDLIKDIERDINDLKGDDNVLTTAHLTNGNTDDLEESREKAADLLSSIARESDFAQAIVDASYTGYNKYEEIEDLLIAIYKGSKHYAALSPKPTGSALLDNAICTEQSDINFNFDETISNTIVGTIVDLPSC